MSERKVRIGFLGVAHMHSVSYASNLRKMAGVEVVGMWDRSPTLAAEWSKRLGVRRYERAEQLLDVEPDAVIVCSENALHRPMVELAVDRVHAILCEKPIAATLADAQAMIDRCAAAGARLQIAFPVRFAPSIQELKRRLDADELGQVFAVNCTNHGSMPGGWFIDPELAGGGAVIDHTVHVIDLLRWFWNAEVTEVYAEVGDSLLHPGLGIDDAGLLSFTLSNGVYGSLDTSWSRPPSYPVWGDVKIEVVGERGVIYLDALHQYVTVASNATGKTQWVSYGSDIDRGLMVDFVDMVRSERTPSITGEDGLAALAVALAAYESARRGEPVTPENVLPTLYR
ncbi:MAG: Gfo/Idh/MocA family oxidoreductase [Caldilinea sp.]|nr:Gfo/Idh/MocA family oxidoreductase [Caldilinea sp.]MDW8439726.1 Gfo/Idh/MocA family oxidoreductase [Caldilineaceae bacterium]